MNLLRGILCAGLHDTYLLTGFAMFNLVSRCCYLYLNLIYNGFFVRNLILYGST